MLNYNEKMFEIIDVATSIQGTGESIPSTHPSNIGSKMFSQMFEN